jgi:hypothetical protein
VGRLPSILVLAKPHVLSLKNLRHDGGKFGGDPSFDMPLSASRKTIILNRAIVGDGGICVCVVLFDIANA